MYRTYALLSIGLKLLGGETLDMGEAMALSHGKDIVDIYSNSWGPIDLGFIVSGPRPLTRRVLHNGISEVSNK